MTGVAERLVSRLADRMVRGRASRRDFLGGAAVVGAAVATSPWSYLTRPATAYESLCGTDAGCNSGYTVFCCTINGGRNACPPNSFVGGWWKADHSNYCGGAARYYIDCNSYRGQGPACHCNTTSCDHRYVNCNQFRYGQCNTQISWAQTGPVLCRMVSCTPPWKRWAGVCSSSSATDNNTAGHTAPCLGDRRAIGSLSAASVDDWTVRLRGWAYDPDTPTASIQVAVHEDDTRLGRFRANRYYARVNQVMHISGNHGFDITVPARPGRHIYRLYAVGTDAAGTPALFGMATLVVGRAPVGHLDSAAAADGSMRLVGWAYDPDAPTWSVTIAVHVDADKAGRFPTDVYRPDVNSARHISGNHGFDIDVPARAGTHTYTVLAQGRTSGGTAGPFRTIASRRITV